MPARRRSRQRALQILFQWDARKLPVEDCIDDFYESLLRLHRDLSDEQSALVNAKLILLLANHIGDAGVLREAMAAAVQDITRTA